MDERFHVVEQRLALSDRPDALIETRKLGLFLGTLALGALSRDPLALGPRVGRVLVAAPQRLLRFHFDFARQLDRDLGLAPASLDERLDLRFAHPAVDRRPENCGERLVVARFERLDLSEERVEAL
jgi:hypothetical protein